MYMNFEQIEISSCTTNVDYHNTSCMNNTTLYNNEGSAKKYNLGSYFILIFLYVHHISIYILYSDIR